MKQGTQNGIKRCKCKRRLDASFWNDRQRLNDKDLFGI